MTRMAKNTTELTSQVEPNNRAMCTTPLVSSSMNPAPRKNICQLGRTRRTGENAYRMIKESPAIKAMLRRFSEGIQASRK